MDVPHGIASPMAEKGCPIVTGYYQPLAKLTGPACMRKLLIILNAVVRDAAAWDPELSGQA